MTPIDEAEKDPGTPLLRWAGSKRKLLPRLLPYWNAAGATRYLEPFVGSAAFFFAAEPQRAVLSDTNEELIQCYESIRSNPDNVATRLVQLPRTKKTYLALRKQDVRDLSPAEKAARFLFLNRNCFNGLYRTNLSGQFNVPYAPKRAGEMPGLDRIRETARRLEAVTFRTGDFEDVLRREVRRGDFVYMDPPYAVANRRIFRQYNATTFGFDDLHRLADLLYAIDALGATFVLSYAVCSEALAAFRSWPHKRVITQRNIAGFAAHRRTSAELLVSNISLSQGARGRLSRPTC